MNGKGGEITHVVLGSKDLERGLDDTSSESENEVESGLLLDVWRISIDLLIRLRFLQHAS